MFCVQPPHQVLIELVAIEFWFLALGERECERERERERVCVCVHVHGEWLSLGGDVGVGSSVCVSGALARFGPLTPEAPMLLPVITVSCYSPG